MKNLNAKLLSLALFLSVFVFSCENLKNDIKSGDEQDPVAAIEFYNIDKKLLEKDKAVADGKAIILVKISVDPKIPLAVNRKFNISTSLGSLMNGGAPVKSMPVQLDENSETTVALNAPLESGTALIAVSSESGEVSNTGTLKFGPAFPSTIHVETPKQTLKDTSATAVTIKLTRTDGLVSTGLDPVLKLYKSGTPAVEAENYAFIKTKTSDSSGVISTTLVLEKTEPGRYIITVTFNGLSNVEGKKEIEVKN